VADMYFKVLLFMKRRPGMSMAEFMDYYENSHSKLGEKYSQGVVRYIRRYLEPQRSGETGCTDELAYDVVTELWFKDEAIYRGLVQYLSTSVMPDDVVTDEAKLFDRSSIRFATIIERESTPEALGLTVAPG
jgi:hypothetical protein